jgi:hypothetical protein
MKTRFTRFRSVPLLLLSLALPVSAQAAYQVVDTKFLVKKLININNGRVANTVFDDLPNPYVPDWDLTLHRSVELQGDLTIREYDRTTISKRTTSLQNVYIIMDLYGIYARAGLTQNTTIPIRGMQGRAIGSIFESAFYGAKAGAGAGLIVGAYPNYSFLVSKSGLRISDVERILRLDLHMGLELGMIKMKFNTESVAKNSKNIEISATAGTVITDTSTEKKSIEDIKRQVVGSK